MKKNISAAFFLTVLFCFSASASPVMEAKKIFDEGRYAEARVEFEKIAAESKEGFNYIMSSYYIARCLEEENQPQKALLIYEEIISVSDEDNFLARSALTRINAIKGVIKDKPKTEKVPSPAEVKPAAPEKTEKDPSMEKPVQRLSAEGGITYYTIKPNDSLSKIAQSFYGNFAYWEMLRDYNNLKSHIIKKGAVLKIPPVDELENFHRVKSARETGEDEKLFKEALNYYIIGEKDKAKDIFLKLSVTADDDEIKPKILYYLGHINYHDLNFKTALGFFRQLVEFYPENDSALSSLYHIILIYGRHIKDDEAFDFYAGLLKQKDSEGYNDFINTLHSSAFTPKELKEEDIIKPKNIKAAPRKRRLKLSLPPLGSKAPRQPSLKSIADPSLIKESPETFAPAAGEREEEAGQIHRFKFFEPGMKDKLERIKKQALLYKEKGMIKNALEIYENAYERGEYDGEILNNLCYMYAEYSLKLQEGIELIDKAISLNDDFIDYYYNTKGFLLYRLNQLNKAKEYTLRALEKKNTAARRYHLALILKAEGNNEKTLEELNKARLLSVPGGAFYDEITFELKTIQK